jgi:DNA-binding transcriptional LysR family regulator
LQVPIEERNVARAAKRLSLTQPAVRGMLARMGHQRRVALIASGACEQAG